MRKKLILSLFLAAILFIVGCQQDTPTEPELTEEECMELINEAHSQITLTSTPITTETYELPISYNGVVIDWQVEQLDNVTMIDNILHFTLTDKEFSVSLVGKFRLEKYEQSFDYTITVAKKNHEIIELINQKVEGLTLPTTTIEDIELPLEYNGVQVSWATNAMSFIEKNGVVHRDIKDRRVTLTASFTYNNVVVTKSYVVTVLKYTNLDLLELTLDTIELPTETNQDLTLIKYYDYDIIGTWSSNNEDIISSNGKVTLPENDTIVTVTVELTLGDDKVEKSFEINILSKNAGKMHQVIVRSNQFDFNLMNGVSYKDNKIMLNDDRTEGTYESGAIDTMKFNELVCSWASTSSSNATVEVLVKVRVDNVWSDYISYYPWGFGLNNACHDQSNSLIKLSTDEVKVLNSKYADAIQFKVILRRTSVSYESPKLSLVTFALNNPSYSYKVDLSSVASSTIYDVPKLYQGEVPTIGNSICSPTTSTMLLKYKGENFSSFDQYEHRYIANKFKDYGNNIFGNWVYNTVGISAFGYDAYVARMYSLDELVLHLANVGPVGLSVKGQMTSNLKDYYTNGHLIVCVGYKYDTNNNLILVCNDPNVPAVLCEYTAAVMENTWRNVAYVVE